MNDCIFCKIIKGEIQGRFVHRDDEIVAFHDINPKAPVHVLILPVKHLESLREVKEENQALLGRIMLAVKNIAEKLNISKNGYKVVINNGQGSGQLVFHLHFHLLGGWKESIHWKV